MNLLPLVLLALFASPEDPDTSAWAARLSAPAAADRDAAADELEARGLGALPLLRALARTGSPEVRSIAADLIERIGTLRLLRPTPVSLDFDDRPVSDAVADLSARTGLGLVLDDAKDAPWKGRRVSLKPGSPIGFWEAVDRLGELGGFRVEVTPVYAYPPLKTQSARLVPREGPPPPISRAGPFHLTLASLNRHREVEQVRPPLEPRVRESFTARLDVVAEPGICLQINGSARIVEATDDRGRDLRPTSTADPTTNHYNFSFRQWDRPDGQAFTYRLPLSLPEDRGRTIARFRGDVPVLAFVRLDEVFACPLDAAQGRTATLDGISLTIQKVEPEVRPTSLEIVAKGVPPMDAGAFAPGPGRRPWRSSTSRSTSTITSRSRTPTADPSATPPTSPPWPPPGPSRPPRTGCRSSPAPRTPGRRRSASTESPPSRPRSPSISGICRSHRACRGLGPSGQPGCHRGRRRARARAPAAPRARRVKLPGSGTERKWAVQARSP